MNIHPPAENDQFVVCVDNDGYEFDLLLQKRYQVIPDAAGEEAGLVRIVDETGEDYLYPRGIFAAADPAKSTPGEMLRAS